jgi:DNA-directed RNA polymerase subunit RPC12/RpoP
MVKYKCLNCGASEEVSGYAPHCCPWCGERALIDPDVDDEKESLWDALGDDHFQHE